MWVAGKREGGASLGDWRPGVEAITVTKLPPDCRRGLRWSLLVSPSLSTTLLPHLALLLARFVRIHDLNSIAFYLPSWGPAVVDDGIAEIRGSGVFPPPSSFSLSLYLLSFLRSIFLDPQIRICASLAKMQLKYLRREEFYLAHRVSLDFATYGINSIVIISMYQVSYRLCYIFRNRVLALYFSLFIVQVVS